MRYNLQAGSCGCWVSHTTTRNGYVVLWHDDRGFTVMIRESKGTSVSGTLSFVDAKAEYIQRVQELLQPGDDQEVTQCTRSK